MSTHYLVDPFTPSQDIIDVTTSDGGQTDSTGALLIRVPDGVAIHGAPADLTSLVDAKTAGLLAFYAGFTSIAADDCLSASGVDLPNSAGVSTGSGVTNHCIFDGGHILTAAVTLPSAPSVCVVVWEAYSFDNVDPVTGRFSRVYVEQDPDLLGCDIRFDGNASTFTTSGTVVNLSPAKQGTSVTLYFGNSSGSRLYLGSWAVIY